MVNSRSTYHVFVVMAMKVLKNRQVGRELAALAEAGNKIGRPKIGWIRTIREYLGMTTGQLAKRLGVVQQRVSAIEDAEQRGMLKIRTLEEAATALNCKLVYCLVPIEPLDAVLKQRAYALAKRRLDLSTHSMDLEAQTVSAQEKNQQLEEFVKELLIKRPKDLWDEE